MALYGVYFGEYKVGYFYISAFSVFHHTQAVTRGFDYLFIDISRFLYELNMQ